jgi:DNA-binding CsgD family transcriptional regulator
LADWHRLLAIDFQGHGLGEKLRAIQGVASGEAIFGPAIARRLMQYFATARPPGLAQTFPELTEREGEILTLIAQGRTNPEIAERLCLSLKTVRNHVSNIFSKLQVADRAQAVVRAREAGLGKPPFEPGQSKSHGLRSATSATGGRSREDSRTYRDRCPFRPGVPVSDSRPTVAIQAGGMPAEEGAHVRTHRDLPQCTSAGRRRCRSPRS